MSIEIGQDFKTQIPALSDDANIQEAFRLYHYGIPTEPDAGTPIASLSIESHLQTLRFDIDNIAAGQAAVTVLDQENLNNVVDSGTYHKPNTPLSGYNYPSLNPGLLIVTATASGSIYQVYQTIGGSAGTNNRWFRGRTATITDWSSWKQVSVSGHSHNDIYYTETEIDEKLSPTMTANAVAVTDTNGKVISSTSISTTELGHLDGTTSNIQDQLNNRYTKAESARIFVQQATPSSPQANDLWIW